MSELSANEWAIRIQELFKEIEAAGFDVKGGIGWGEEAFVLVQKKGTMHNLRFPGPPAEYSEIDMADYAPWRASEEI